MLVPAPKLKIHRTTSRNGVFRGPKVLTAAFAALFLVLQLTSLVHSAEHEFKHHQHNGIDCALTAYCDRMGDADVPVAAHSVAQVIVQDHALPVVTSRTIAPAYRRNARAPPHRA